MLDRDAKRNVKREESDGPALNPFSSLNSSESSLPSSVSGEVSQYAKVSTTTSSASGIQSNVSPSGPQSASSPTYLASPANISALVCNVHETTGESPPGMIGTSTTISGDNLYVFGGRSISDQDAVISSNMYELNLLRRHWTKLRTRGSLPAPRYFHSVCALGDTKLVCYGGMTPVQQASIRAPDTTSQTDPGLLVLSDVYIYDIPTLTWTAVTTKSAPIGRYAHCATILPSSTVFSSSSAHLSAIQHNPSAGQNHGSLGVSIDGSGGAQMIILGGQDDANKYIDQISVFNLRSLTWTTHSPVDRSYGAYRSVITPLIDRKWAETDIDTQSDDEEDREENDIMESGGSMLIYSNYNFLDVKIELEIRQPDGSFVERQAGGRACPPGLRFPTGGVIDGHFVLSGIHMTTSKQEYMVWTLDLQSMLWKKIDTGFSMSSGSWNRGILWARHNSYVILGDEKSTLVDDYNKRKVNFSNICVLELEAFGIYSNPCSTFPTSNFISASSPHGVETIHSSLARKLPSLAGKSLGRIAGISRELSDMDLLAIGGERIPVNSHLVAHRWGPFFSELLQNGLSEKGASDNFILTGLNGHVRSITDPTSPGSPISTSNAYARQQPRLLYLPHTVQTLRALTHYLYTNDLPPPQHPLNNAHILCSLLQLARPYRISGLFEATVKRLHEILDGRNTATVFNAAAMACGGGDGLKIGIGANSERDASTPVPNLPPVLEPLENYPEKRMANKNRTESPAIESETDEKDEHDKVIWDGELSPVVGLQKRGLRGLMEGRRLRERLGGRRENGGGSPTTRANDNGLGMGAGSGSTTSSFGLGIA